VDLLPAFALLTTALGLLGAPEPRDRSLADLLACHDSAAGGPALRAVRRLEYRLMVEEGGAKLRGRYLATRDGRMRIDVFTDGIRVYSEGWDGRRAWQLPQDSARPVPSAAQAGAALRHGLEQPGHLWTLADMPRNGHRLKLLGREPVDGTRYYVVRLTLSDGFRSWYLVDPTTCLIGRKRDFRAFHPDQEPHRKWVESAFDDFRTVAGITKPYRMRDIDRASGKIISTTRVLEIALDPGFDPETMTPRPGDPAPAPP
jgi:hypothetical protein